MPSELGQDSGLSSEKEGVLVTNSVLDRFQQEATTRFTKLDSKFGSLLDTLILLRSEYLYAWHVLCQKCLDFVNLYAADVEGKNCALRFTTDRFLRENVLISLTELMKTLPNKPEFSDLKVEVEGKNFFNCHTFVLVACSDFFRCMLNTEMKEKQDKIVSLGDISASTFQLILEMLYTSNNILSVENIVDVWQAVHQLQIPFLIEYCESFVLENLSMENLESFKQHADYLHSKKIKESILRFIMKHFLEAKEIFLRLSLEDAQQIIENDDLVIRHEDDALQAIYEWASLGDRRLHLTKLLLCCRYYLASDGCLAKLYENQLNDNRAKDILFKATSFKLTNFMRGKFDQCFNLQKVFWV